MIAYYGFLQFVRLNSVQLFLLRNISEKFIVSDSVYWYQLCLALFRKLISWFLVLNYTRILINILD